MLTMALVGGIVAVIVVALWMVVASSSSGARPMRNCPVCGSELGMDERVFADQVEHSDRPHELTIKGCSRCYDRDSDSGS